MNLFENLQMLNENTYDRFYNHVENIFKSEKYIEDISLNDSGEIEITLSTVDGYYERKARINKFITFCKNNGFDVTQSKDDPFSFVVFKNSYLI